MGTMDSQVDKYIKLAIPVPCFLFFSMFWIQTKVLEENRNILFISIGLEQTLGPYKLTYFSLDDLVTAYRSMTPTRNKIAGPERSNLPQINRQSQPTARGSQQAPCSQNVSDSTLLSPKCWGEELFDVYRGLWLLTALL